MESRPTIVSGCQTFYLSNMHFNGRFILNIARFARLQGGDYQELIRAGGHSEEVLAQEDCRLGPEVYNRVLMTAMKQTGDQLFGLHLGQHMNLSAAGLVAQIAHTSETVQQAMQYCCDFSNLACSALPLSLVKEKNYYEVIMRPEPAWLHACPICAEQTTYGHIIFSIREFQSLTGNEFFPARISLAFKRHDRYQELEEALKTKVDYSQKETVLYFHPSHFRQKIMTSNIRLLRVLVEHAKMQQRELAQQASFSEIVRNTILQLVKPSFPTLEQVARQLNMSSRSLQRKVREEGRSFRDLANDLRQEFAHNYLQDASLSISEIAFLLDYADASAFVRSFKKWTGKTPGIYREHLKLVS